MTSRQQLREKGLEALRVDLSGRDLAVLAQVGELRLMATEQIRAVYFATDAHPSAVAAIRSCNRCLNRLVEYRALIRLARRVGGVRGGSSSYLYALGPVGQRLLNLEGARRRFREPSAVFVDHTLAVSQVIVDLCVAAKSEQFDLLAVQAEPRCWRTFSGSGGRVLMRPDAYVALGVGEFEHRYFVEVDRGTEHLPALLRKCHVYEAYYASGREQATGGVFPRICWLMPSTERSTRLIRAIAASGNLTNELFTVIPQGAAVETLSGRLV